MTKVLEASLDIGIIDLKLAVLVVSRDLAILDEEDMYGG
jgi:hypothetical protein